MQRLSQYLNEEYHQLQEVLWGSGYSKLYSDLPPRRVQPNHAHDACRVHGTLTLNKVAGNFHVTAGKVLPIAGAHAHMTGFMDKTDYNFTHRIEKLSFGDPHAGIIMPLEGEEKISDISNKSAETLEKYFHSSFFADLVNFQYFIEIVPTDIWSFTGRKTTYQYSVKEHARPINHEAGSHGTPGIYFKYDLAAFKVEVTKDREGVVQFAVRLCASVGGLVATSQIVCGLVKSLLEFVCCLTEKSGQGRTRTSTSLLTEDSRTT